jgi:hypothetical protein
VFLLERSKMSLSPEDYKECIGIARCETGSCLVYLDKLLSEDPCGCDGWDLEIVDNMLHGHGRFFPPQSSSNYDETVTADLVLQYHLDQSKLLLKEVERIRQDYLERRGDV